jgi:Tfp pilus assembly protein PilO
MEEKSMLINADRYLLVSGQRFYFYEQKKSLQSEIERLNELYKKYYYKKKMQKVDLAELKEKMAKMVSRYESEISGYKSRVKIKFKLS